MDEKPTTTAAAATADSRVIVVSAVGEQVGERVPLYIPSAHA